MFSFWIKEDQIIWLALMVSLIIHGFLFIFSGTTTFIQNAKYSVRPSAQMVEVSLRGAREVSDEAQTLGGAAKPTVTRKDTRSEKAASAISGVKVKASPDYFQNPAPEYPELAKQMRQEGMIMLSVDVNKEGNPVNIEIIQSSGYRLLDQAALKAVEHWKFQPGSMDNISIESRVNVPIRFRLEK